MSCRAFVLVSVGVGMIMAMKGANPDEAAGADPASLFEARVYEDAKGEKLSYRLLKPKDYDPKTSYPLVLFLHGAGERGSDNLAQLKHGMADFAGDEAREKHAAFVVAPQCPAGQQWVAVPFGSVTHTMPEQPAPGLRMALELVEHALPKEFNIDKRRLYVTGLSMGGFGTWDAVQRRPDLFAAAIPICGGGDTAQAKRIAVLPIWVFHGDRDTAVKTERSRDMVEALKAAGGSPMYTEYPNTGHDSWSATYKNPEVHAWLFRQKRTD
jgi:predicted peptidase